MKKERKALDIINGPLYTNIFIYSIPVVFSSLLQMFFNSADTIIVGHFAGDAALAAVGSTGSIVFLLTSLFNGLSTGANVLIAHQIGTGNEKGIRKSVHTSISVALVSGLFLTIVGIAFAKSLLMLMDTPADILDLSALYMRIYFAGVIFLLLYNFGSAVLRSKGETKKPLYFLIISGSANVIFNFITVSVFNWSVAGVASATVVSESISAFLVIRELVKSTDFTKLNIRELSIDRKSLLEILRIGIPAGLSGSVFALSNVVIQSSINSFNSIDVNAGNSAGANIENYVYIGYMAFNQAAITFTSQCMGAGKIKRIKEIMLKTLLLVTIGATITGNLVYLAGPYALKLYTTEQAAADIGMIRIAIVARFLGLNGILDTFVNSLRGMGYSTLPTILMIAGICGVRLIWIYTVFPVNHTIQTIYYCFPLSWIITAVIELILWIIAYRKVEKQYPESTD